MSTNPTLVTLRQRYLARLALRQISPNARQFFVGVLSNEDLADLGLNVSELTKIETEIMEGCLKDGLIVRDLVLERGKDTVQPMGMVTEAGLKWVEQNAGPATGKGD